MGVTRDIRFKDRLKHEGHDLIDSLRRMGVPYATCYRFLSRDLGWPEYRCHFQIAHTIEDYQRMVASLHRFHDMIRGRRNGKSWRKKLKKQKKQEVVNESPKDPGPLDVPETPRMTISKKRDTLSDDAMKEAFKQLGEYRRREAEFKSIGPEHAARKDSPFRSVLKKMCML